MKLAIILVAVMLTGCAAPFELYAHYANSQDPCLRQNNGGNYPNWCGAGGHRSYIYNTNGAQVGYTKK